MSEETSTIIFEHPLNEKMRSWLRIENSLIQLNSFQSINSLSSALSFFRAVSEFIEVLDRGEIRAELLKELEKDKKNCNSGYPFLMSIKRLSVILLMSYQKVLAH